MLRKITILLILVSIPLQARASEEKGWYPFIQNQGWYPSRGQAASTESAGEQDKSLVQPVSQPGMGSTPTSSTNTNTTANTTSQTTPQPGQSNWFKQ